MPFSCPVCFGTSFRQYHILWPALIEEWRLSPEEAALVDRQQGLVCTVCSLSMRMLALANALTRVLGRPGDSLPDAIARLDRCDLLEINPAGNLTPLLAQLRGHVLVEHPAVDMRALPFADQSFDVVCHSDTLEHVADPVAGLAECCRVLRPGGHLCFTVPLLTGRMTRSRPAEAPSYHGTEADPAYLVQTEYGADAWTQVLDAGFDEVRVVPLEHPTSYAIVARTRQASVPR